MASLSFWSADSNVARIRLAGVLASISKIVLSKRLNRWRTLSSLGGNPEQGGSMSGSLHRAWVDIKTAVTGKDDAAVLTECERGEDSAKQAYADALKKDLPAAVRSIVERQYQGVRENHDRIRDRRNAVAH